MNLDFELRWMTADSREKWITVHFLSSVFQNWQENEENKKEIDLVKSVQRM